MIYFFLILGFLTQAIWADTDLCDIIDLDACGSLSRQFRRSSSASLPSPASAANLNPANVSFDRGFGVEAVYQANNPVRLNLASGNGKLGGALISQSLENSFFGNRVIELDDVILERVQDKQQYETQKLNLALGGKLIRKKHFSLDMGLLLKRHSELKKINPGVGISTRIGPIHLGSSVYQDDLLLVSSGHIDPSTGFAYSLFAGKETYSEKFTVQTFSLGTRIRNLSLDAGVITTKYELYPEASVIRLYSGSLALGQYLFNFALRNEVTQALKVINGKLIAQSSQSNTFGGIQRSFGKHLIFGVNYNFYLLKELSLNGTFFF
jgi:hypothetical protein